MDFIWHFYNFTLFQHCLPIFSVFFPMFFQRVLSPGEPCGSAPWGLRNTGAVPHFRGVSRVTWSPSWKQHELSSTCTTVVLEFSNNVQECTVVLILILESSEFMYNISQHIITCQHVVLSETFRTFRTFLGDILGVSHFGVAWRRAEVRNVAGATAGRAAARARQDMASGARATSKYERKKYRTNMESKRYAKYGRKEERKRW